MKVRRFLGALHVRLLAWCLPYGVIWAAAYTGIASLSRAAPCTGFCAVYVGSTAYITVAVAAALTAVVAATELALLAR